MQYTKDASDFAEWMTDNPSADEATKLAALREFIVQYTRDHVEDGTLGETWSCDRRAEWANKKLRKLGIAEVIEAEHLYQIEVPVIARVTLDVYGKNRAEALQYAEKQFQGDARMAAHKLTPTGPMVFASGPEDAGPTVVDDDAPQTVHDTLMALREIIMLAVVAGPHICTHGANQAMDAFGLARLPERKTFTVTRPALATMTTTVVAYDEESALRVAGWRWEDGRKSFTTSDAAEAGDLVVEAPAS